jgi:hypothetical protein
MTLLKDASKLYVGSSTATAVYAGTNKVWSSFNPISLGGLVTWLDASQLALANGAAVSPWTDMSGNGNHGTIIGTPAPVLKTNMLNGKPVVRFTISEGRVRRAWPYPIYDWTVIYIVRLWGANVGRAFSVQYPPSNLLVGFHSSNADTFYDNGTFLGGVSWASYITDLGRPWRMYTGDSKNTVGTRFFINGTLIGSAGGTGGFTNGWGMSGYDPTLTPETCDIDVPELLLYDHRLVDADRIAAQNYMATKWGLS